MRGKKTPIEKKEAVRAAIEINPSASIRDIGKIVDLPYKTVHDIIPEVMGEDEFNRYRTEEKKKAIVKGWEIATLYMNHLKEPEVIEKASARDSAIVMGTSIDKIQVLAGEPSSIVEHQEPTPALIKEMDAKMDKMKQLISKSG